MEIARPYLLFLGDAADPLAAKTAQGVADWRRDWCVGQMRLPNCNADIGLPEMNLEQAKAAGVKTLVVGVANRGGIISDAWISILEQALNMGMDLAAGLHSRLADVPVLRDTAARLGRSLWDVRHPRRTFSVANGKKRPGKRLLTVGTDVSCGKKYTALAIEKELRRRGVKADFRATGQTGILIAGTGVAVDAVVADFISGAAEWLSPANDPDHWDVVEGQGSLFHASYAGVTLGLIHGSQPDLLVLCHEPTRPHMRGLPDYPLPKLEDTMAVCQAAARVTNPAARFVGVSINTSRMAADKVELYLREVEARLNLPTVDSVKTGVGRICDRIA